MLDQNNTDQLVTQVSVHRHLGSFLVLFLGIIPGLMCSILGINGGLAWFRFGKGSKSRRVKVAQCRASQLAAQCPHLVTRGSKGRVSTPSMHHGFRSLTQIATAASWVTQHWTFTNSKPCVDWEDEKTRTRSQIHPPERLVSPWVTRITYCTLPAGLNFFHHLYCLTVSLKLKGSIRCRIFPLDPKVT